MRLADRYRVAKHHGPGPHPGTGTEQTVHGGGAPGADESPRRKTPAQKAEAEWKKRERLAWEHRTGRHGNPRAAARWGCLECRAILEHRRIHGEAAYGWGFMPAGPPPIREGRLHLEDIVKPGAPMRTREKILFGIREGQIETRIHGQNAATVRARLNAFKAAMAEDFPSLRKVKMVYYLTWEETREKMRPPSDGGSYPAGRYSTEAKLLEITPTIAQRFFYADKVYDAEGRPIPDARGVDLEPYRVLAHELIHAASPFEGETLWGELEITREEGCAELLSLRWVAKHLPLEQYSGSQKKEGNTDGQPGEYFTGLSALVRDTAYAERVMEVVMWAGEQVGWKSREAVWAKIEEVWRDTEWQSGVQGREVTRYRYRPDLALDAEQYAAKRVAEEERDYATRIAGANPEYLPEYKRQHEDLLAYIRQSAQPNWQHEALQNWQRAADNARAHGVDMDRHKVHYDAATRDFSSLARLGARDTGEPSDDVMEQICGYTYSLLHWLLEDAA